MRKLLLKICYDGSDFCGWQVQPNGITVQETICTALSDLLSENVGVTGCSRTDSGVHANEFYCHFTTENAKIDEKGFVGGLNVRLPDSVSVLECMTVSDDFHARYSAKAKQYIYKMYLSNVRSPSFDRYALRISNPLDIKAVTEFCSYLIGTHDFKAFSASGRNYDTTVRTITDCSIEFKDGIYIFSITGDGFLYNMVRIIVGTALFVYDGKIKPQDIPEIMSKGDRSFAGPTAPPHGLYLNKVFY